MVAGAFRVAPFNGDVSATLGRALVLAVTVTDTDADVRLAPALSVALAASVNVPAGTLGTLRVYGEVVSVPISRPLR